MCICIYIYFLKINGARYNFSEVILCCFILFSPLLRLVLSQGHLPFWKTPRSRRWQPSTTKAQHRWVGARQWIPLPITQEDRKLCLKRGNSLCGVACEQCCCFFVLVTSNAGLSMLWPASSATTNSGHQPGKYS